MQSHEPVPGRFETQRQERALPFFQMMTFSNDDAPKDLAGPLVHLLTLHEFLEVIQSLAESLEMNHLALSKEL